MQPILYSFRRCPYAMRARLAISIAGIECELREIVLRDKAPQFLQASATGTVPILQTGDGVVIEESFDIMLWALAKSDPDNWLENQQASLELIQNADNDFKKNLDLYKYASRHPERHPEQARDDASVFLAQLNDRLAEHDYLLGLKIRLADMAIAPFVRQFANVDRPWFDAEPWPHLQRWLTEFIESDLFNSIMKKYPKWQSGDPVVLFPEAHPVKAD